MLLELRAETRDWIGSCRMLSRLVIAARIEFRRRHQVRDKHVGHQQRLGTFLFELRGMSRDAVGDQHVGHELGDAGEYESHGYHQSTQHQQLPFHPEFQLSTRIRMSRDAVGDRHVGHELNDAGGIRVSRLSPIDSASTTTFPSRVSALNSNKNVPRRCW